MSAAMTIGHVPADIVLTGGKILTVDPAFRITEAVAISGDRVRAVGTDAEIAALCGPATTRIALGGRTVVPGLIDTHAHLDNEGLKAVYPSLADCRSIADVQARIAALAKAAAPGAWIVTMPIGTPPYYRDGADALVERRYPNRWELDEAAPDHPVFIKPILGYWRGLGGFPLVSVANSRALTLCGVGRDAMPPWSGIMIDRRLATGEPTGIFYEWTQISVVELTLMRDVPRFSYGDRAGGLARGMATYNATGTTSIVETHGVLPPVIRAYRELEDAGRSTVRAHLMVSPQWGTTGADEAAERMREWYGWCAGRGLGNAWLRVGGIHTRIGGQTPDARIRIGAMPYTGWSGYAPDSEVPRDMVREVVLEAARMGMRVTTLYADCLDLFEEANRVRSIVDRRWVISHLRSFTAGEIARIRDLGLVVTTQTNRWIADQGSALRARLGPEREDEIVPLRRLREAGVPFALATDNTPTSLFHPLWHCVARRNTHTGEVIALSQKLTRAEALHAATLGGAYVTFEEHDKGSIEPGKLADLAVLDADYLTVPEDAIRDLKSVLTMVGGRVVHRAEGAPVAMPHAG